ncbi:IspD/TarI family cytidylyltransferase [Spiroplasma cantharicola]|uniref:2-C-methyl-D-erythritol 4-phosphate cytidylyltransferase n=1 Tax=Spiroplasma cantharicola TaxID=362837 RepID=A0A0M4JVT2_9MOLU|nr:IspD/TarI family cytidylyltransferase [Spiroplasma cantharicola]ALD65930.1 2-C-methyl-D-erythritol 4-phosphate cytidylyltransferase [Spiroplasma cantharicola]
MVSLIIVANGSSERFGQNKMLVKIENQFLVNQTISNFYNIKDIKEIILVSNKEVFNVIKDNKIILIEGGATRSESVKKGLAVCKQKYVLIHDGARPFISKNLIISIIENLKLHDCVVPVLKITNCLKLIKNNKIKTVNREEYIQTQTPQGFKTELIKEAYEKKNIEAFDDCQLIEKQNNKIKFIDGDDKNIKITFKNDLKSYS